MGSRGGPQAARSRGHPGRPGRQEGLSSPCNERSSRTFEQALRKAQTYRAGSGKQASAFEYGEVETSGHTRNCIYPDHDSGGFSFVPWGSIESGMQLQCIGFFIRLLLGSSKEGEFSHVLADLPTASGSVLGSAAWMLQPCSEVLLQLRYRQHRALSITSRDKCLLGPDRLNAIHAFYAGGGAYPAAGWICSSP